MRSRSPAGATRLRKLLVLIRSNVRPLASEKGVVVALHHAGAWPECRVNGRALTTLLTRFLAALVRLTPPGRRVDLTARALRRSAGDSWAEISIRSPRARLGKRDLDRLLKTVGPMKLAEVITDLHRGELRVTVLSRLARLRGGWFVIRQGVHGVPLFAVVCRGKAAP